MSFFQEFCLETRFTGYARTDAYFQNSLFLNSSPLVNMHRPPTDLEEKTNMWFVNGKYSIHVDAATVLLSCLTFRLDFVRNFKELNEI